MIPANIRHLAGSGGEAPAGGERAIPRPASATRAPAPTPRSGSTRPWRSGGRRSTIPTRSAASARRSASTRWPSAARSRPRSTPTWAPRRSRSGTDEEVEKLQWAEQLGRRHGDGPLHRRRPRRVPRRRSSTHAHGADRHRADLLDDHRPKHRGPRLRRRSCETLEHQARAGRRLLHHPRRRAARAPAATSQTALIGIVSPRRLAARQVDDRTTASRTRCTTLWDEICDIMREYDVTFSHRRRPASRRPRRRHRRARSSPSCARSASSTERAWRKGVQVMIEGPGPRAVRPDRVQHEARSGSSATARRSTCSARS